MKYIYTSILLLILTAPQTFAIDFYSGDYKSALQKAKTEDKPILLYFTAVWCGPCQFMQQNIFPDHALTAYVNANFIALKVDVDSQTGRKLYYKFEHQGVPDFYIITAGEEILKRKIGGMKLNQLQSFLTLEKPKPTKLAIRSDSIAAASQKADELVDSAMLKKYPELAKATSYKKAKSDSAANRDYEEMAAKRKTGWNAFYHKTRLSSWKPGISLGATLNSLHGAHADNNVIPGYQITLLMNYTKPSFSFQPGLQFNLKAGSLLGDTYRVHYVELPLMLAYRIGSHRWFGGKEAIWFNATPYGAYSLSGNNVFSPAVSDFSRWNYGVKAGLSASMGSFIPALGYDVGLADLDKSPAGNIATRSYYVSFALIIGK